MSRHDRPDFELPRTLGELRALLSPQRFEPADVDRGIAPAPATSQQPSIEYKSSPNLKKGLLGEESAVQDAAARGDVVWSAHLNIRQVNRGGADATFLRDGGDGRLTLVLNDNKVKNDGAAIASSTALVENRSDALNSVKEQATAVADDSSAPTDSRKVAIVVEALIERHDYQFEVTVNGATRSTPGAVTQGLQSQGVEFTPPRVDAAAPNRESQPPTAPELGSAGQPPPTSGDVPPTAPELGSATPSATPPPANTSGAQSTTTPTGFK